MNVCALPQGLDAHFIAQLNSTSRFLLRLFPFVSPLLSISSRSFCSACKPMLSGVPLRVPVEYAGLCRDSMWIKLDAEYKTMEDHVRVQTQSTTDFVKAMEPMYKYALPSAPLVARLSFFL